MSFGVIIPGHRANLGRNVPLAMRQHLWGGPTVNPFQISEDSGGGSTASRTARLEQARISMAARRGLPDVNAAFYQQQTQEWDQQATPRAWPPGMTFQESLELLETQRRLQFLPTMIEIVPNQRMPASGQPFTEMNASAMTQPAVGSDQIVVAFRVPKARNGMIQKISNQSAVGGFSDGSGQLSWRIDINGNTYSGFNNVIASIGTMSNPADFADGPIPIFENDVVQLILRNVSLIAGPGIIQGMLRGYYYPIAREKEAVGF